MEFSEPYQITPSDPHHFFGYYETSPWSPNLRFFVCLETDFHDHMPKIGEKARILLLDLREETHRILTDTQAWNFQQGCLLHWMPSTPNDEIIFNDCDSTGIFSRVLNVHSGEEYKLPRAINAIAHTKDLALCVNFARLRKNRPVISYPCEYNYSSGDSHPSEDGVFLMDLKTGETELIVALDDIWNRNEITREGKGISAKTKFNGTDLWFDHMGFSPDDSRFFFFARFTNWVNMLETSMWTINLNGSDPYLVVDFNKQLSHFGWYDNSTLIVTMKYLRESNYSHVLIKDKNGEARVIAPHTLVWDGHPVFSPDKHYMATDTYIVKNKRYIYIMNMKTEELHRIAEFENPKQFDKEIRCDPHPRWSPNGTQLCYDGLRENGRQVYGMNIK